VIRLPYAGNFIFIDPEKIKRVVPVVIKGADIGHCDIYTGESYSQRVEVSAVDVCRLKAAWERRYTVPEVIDNGDLPIFLAMNDHGIQISCCDYTRKLREARQAVSKPRASSPGRQGLSR
jgi:hypothetical protein